MGTILMLAVGVAIGYGIKTYKDGNDNSTNGKKS